MSTIEEVLAGTAKFAVVCGDATEVIKSLPNNSISVCYCDPPYGLSSQNTADVLACLTAWLAGKVYTHHRPGFMGKDWDAFVPGPEAWREVYRVLKPGAYCVAYSSTRTVDLLGIAMRLGGLEPRNGWAWITGQGFPKNLDVGKALDKMARATREVVGYDASRARPNRIGQSGAIGNIGGNGVECDRTDNGATLTAPATDAAKQWDGYGTDVKPSYEPLVVTRKPLDGTVASNVLTHGTGALNIDAARLSTTEVLQGGGGKLWSHYRDGTEDRAQPKVNDAQGRFPSSIALIHDDGCTQDGLETTDEWRCTPTCAVRVLGEQSGELTSGKPSGVQHVQSATYGQSRPGREVTGYGDTGTAARFFYQGKASAKDRLAYLTCSPDCTANNTVAPAKQADPDDPCPVCNHTRTVYLHPTVKPYELAAYHAKLLSLPPHTRPIAIVPFCGTGVEARALLDVGYRVIAVDIDPRHVAMTRYRLSGDQPVREAPVTVQETTEAPETAAPLTLDDLFGF